MLGLMFERGFRCTAASGRGSSAAVGEIQHGTEPPVPQSGKDSRPQTVQHKSKHIKFDDDDDDDDDNGGGGGGGGSGGGDAEGKSAKHNAGDKRPSKQDDGQRKSKRQRKS